MNKDELMEDSTEYCCYCGTPKVSFGCCGENHYETFAQMSSEDQDDFLQPSLEQVAPLIPICFGSYLGGHVQAERSCEDCAYLFRCTTASSGNV